MDNFDTERFIIEIHNRPSIWDNSSQDYSNKDLKKQCWADIVDLFRREELSDGEKNLFGIELQKRWKNIRSCYAREVKRQKNLKSGAGSSNRKSEYIYFKQLQFLQKVVSNRDSREEVEEENEDDEVTEPPKKIIKKERQMSEDDTIYVQPLNISIEPRRRPSVEIDEDRLFLLSLLSTLNGLPPHIKMTTKIKILTLLNEASDYFG